MPNDFFCPHCASPMQAPDGSTGMVTRCGKCGTLIEVPMTDADFAHEALRDRVRARLRRPAKGLIIMALIDIAIMLPLTLTMLPTLRQNSLAGYAVFAIGMDFVILFGATIMLNPGGAGWWRWSLVGCAAAFIPHCSITCLPAAPFAIWGVVVLFNSETTEAFYPG